MKLPQWLLVMTTLITTGGCQTSDPELARQALSSQAAQNEAMAALQREVAAGARELTVADAEARRQSVVLQQGFQAEQNRLNAGWSDLHSQRRREVFSLRTDSFLTAIVQGSGGTAAALLALAIFRCVMTTRSECDDAELTAFILDAFPPADDPPCPSHELPSLSPANTMRLANQPQEEP